MVVEQLPAVLWSTDMELRFTSSQGAGLAEIGLQPDQIVGMRLAEFLDTDDPTNESIAAHRRALHGDVVIYDTEWQTRCFHVRVQPLRDSDGRVVGTNGVAIDVTEHRQAEASLRQSESRFRSLAQNALDMTSILAADGRVLYESPANERILGYSTGERATTDIFSLVHPDDLPLVREQFAASLAQPETAIRTEVRVRHQDGSWR